MPPDSTGRPSPVATLSDQAAARSDVAVVAPPRFRLPADWQALLDAMPGAVWLVDVDELLIIAANAAAGALVGLPARHWIGRPVAALSASPEDVCFWDEARAGLAVEIDSETFVLRGTTAVPVTRRITRIGSGPDTVRAWVVAMHDRSEEVAAQRELSLAAADLRATLESTHDGLLVTDLGGRIRNFNRRFATLWSLPAELLVRGDDDGVFESMRRAVVDPPNYMRRLAAIDDDALGESTDLIHLRSGRIIERVIRPQLACGRPIGRVASFRDVTDAVDAEHRVQMLAFVDALTGLPNRRLLGDRVAQSLATARRDGTGFGLLSIDFDDFAGINVRLGRRAADDVLREAASRIAGCLRQVDTVARVGSDEFAVLVQQTDAAGAEMAAMRVAAALEKPIAGAGGDSTVLGASIGIVLCPNHGADIDTLLDRAGAAMREVKQAGRAGYRFWHALASPDGRAAGGPR